MMRRLGFVAGSVAAAAVVSGLAPGVAAADVIFDPADAEELVATLDEAFQAQGVCYGWTVRVDNEGVADTSSGSNFGYGRSLSDEAGNCESRVEFLANIEWTSESSEAEDSASYSVDSLPSGPSTADLDSLEIISEDGLKGDDVDSDVYKAVAALPLLAADSGIADPIEASPAPEAESGDAVPTDSPSSDFWRQSGNQILLGALLLLGGGVFGWFAFRSSRGRRLRFTPVGPPEEQIPEYVPPEWTDAEPTTPVPAQSPENTATPVGQSKPAEPSEPAEPAEPSEPAEPAELAEPAGPSEPAESTEPAAGQSKPAESTEPEEPGEDSTAEPARPAPEPDSDAEDKPGPETRPEG
ncbi:MAG: hypothetical protein GEV28_07925 [Actinophytocola sp.]|uniref:hypothetical protein n=1 Tax=Actinophytocola sp. TaxID=1872138 RepID=UPI001320A442|nr:hypothetical protein [Actinophytocola sp.]MPZ80314.1 hypothetical protein [Actinophytocola sp.]